MHFEFGGLYMEGHIFGNFMVTVNTCRCTSMQYQRIQLHVIKCVERIMDWLALTHKPCVMTVIIINYSQGFYSRGKVFGGSIYLPLLCDQAILLQFPYDYPNKQVM